MNNHPSIPPAKETLSAQVKLNYLVICLMMACFSIVAVNAVTAAIPAWNGAFLVVLTFLIAIESFASYWVVKNSNLLKSNPLTSRITEWVVILILIKLVMYLFSNPAQLLTDITVWQHDFGSFFMKGGYFAVCIYLFFIWLLALTFANYLENLEEDKFLLDLERQGDIRSTRSETRKSILGLVFGMGLAMVFLTMLSNLGLTLIPLKSQWVPQDVILILLFFFLGLTLLAQAQNLIQRAHWYIENIPVNPLITSRWISYSILAGVFIVLIAIVISKLLGNYSIGFLQIIRAGLGIIVGVFSFLQVVILAPLLGLLWLILHLLGQTGKTPSVPGLPLAIPTPATPTPSPPAAPNSLAEVIQSILFWGIFLFVIFYAFRHYLSQRQELLSGLRRIPLWSWVRMAFKWFSTRIRSANQQISAILDAGVARFQTLIKPKPARIDPLLAVSSLLPPRQRVLLIYLSMIQWNNRNGFPRKGHQTPFEYAHSLDSSVPESREDLEVITRTFIEARYTRHPLTSGQADLVQIALERVQVIFSQYMKQQSQNTVGK